MCCKKDIGRGATFDGEQVAISEGCFKLHETDWLEGLPAMDADNDIFEVRFKNTRRGYYKNVNGLELRRGDVVAVESSPGHDIGIVSLTGDMVARQMRRTGFNPQNGEYRKIYRKAKPYDIEKWQEAIALEHGTMIRSRQIAADMGLNMKIGDVEYQGDRLKAIFYYIADERVDFRELIKVFAEQFRIRVEMKQIGARQEAGRIGGLGACGRELCCASWVSNFISVTTNAARVQDISLNPQKLAGQCSKLKCCLVYELDDYLDARKEFPRVREPLQALDGEYHLVKTDILGRRMSFSTSPTAMVGVVTLPIARVREIIELNKRGKKVERMEDAAAVAAAERAQEPGFVNMVGEESITRFDRSGAAKRGRRRGEGQRGTKGEGRGEGDAPQGEQRRDDRTRNTGGRRDGNGQSTRPRGERVDRAIRGESAERGENPRIEGRGDENKVRRNRNGARPERRDERAESAERSTDRQSRGEMREKAHPEGRGEQSAENRGVDTQGRRSRNTPRPERQEQSARTEGQTVGRTGNGGRTDGDTGKKE